MTPEPTSVILTQSVCNFSTRFAEKNSESVKFFSSSPLEPPAVGSFFP
jgi:hypothetical protein